MKNYIVLIAMALCYISFGQEIEDKKRANEVGLEVIGIADAQFLLTYERSFGKHWTGLIGFGPKSEEGLFNSDGIDRERLKTDGVGYSGYKFLLEGRYYLDEFVNGRAVGFYVGLYAKFSSFNSELDGLYTSSEGEDFNFLLDADMNVRSLGFMVGYKLPLSKRFALDFLIAGPGTGNYNFSFQNRSDELPDEFFEDLNEALENFGIFDLIDSDFDFNRNRRRSIFNTISFRYALSLKYNF